MQRDLNPVFYAGGGFDLAIIMDDGRCSAGDDLWPSGFNIRLHLVVSLVTMTMAQHWRNPKHAWRRHFKCDRIINNNDNDDPSRSYISDVSDRLQGELFVIERPRPRHQIPVYFCLVEELPHDSGQSGLATIEKVMR